MVKSWLLGMCLGVAARLLHSPLKRVFRWPVMRLVSLGLGYFGLRARLWLRRRFEVFDGSLADEIGGGIKFFDQFVFGQAMGAFLALEVSHCLD